MYIMEVIRKADALYPNEFTVEEKIGWIDELNAKLANEYNKKYDAVTLYPAPDGSYLLPEDIGYERIHSIRSGEREIKKEDFTTYNVKFLYISGGRRIIKTEPESEHSELTVIYLKPAEQIRTINIKNAKIRLDDKNTGFFIDKVLFRGGDIINIKVYDEARQNVTKDMELNVMSVTMPKEDSTEFFIECVTNTAGDLGDFAADIAAEKPIDIMRVITEKTVCSIPYDDMFIQWLCAKICFWQKDFTSYNQHMTVFNQTLSDYWHHIMERHSANDHTQWKGWI